MNIFFTSDLHFGHGNIIKYCRRSFDSVDAMNDALIENWNARVQHDDMVYVLGDMFFCDASAARGIMHRLHGTKRLVLGNHDKLIRAEPYLQKLFETLNDLDEEMRAMARGERKASLPEAPLPAQPAVSSLARGTPGCPAPSTQPPSSLVFVRRCPGSFQYESITDTNVQPYRKRF